MSTPQRGAQAPQTQALVVTPITPIETATQAIALVPQSLDGAMQLAVWLAKSSFLPESLRGKEGDIFCLVLAGVELGLPPMAALRGLYIVNGKTAMESKTKAAVCIQRGAALYFRRTEYTPLATTWETQRRGEAEARLSRYTRKEADEAGLLRKQGPWQQYTQRMISHRALGWLCDDTYPDVVLGVATAEDFDDPETIAFQPVAAVSPGVDLGTVPPPRTTPAPASSAAKPAPPEDRRAALTEEDVVGIIEELSRAGTRAAVSELVAARINAARPTDEQRARLLAATNGQLAEIKRADAENKA